MINACKGALGSPVGSGILVTICSKRLSMPNLFLALISQDSEASKPIISSI